MKKATLLLTLVLTGMASSAFAGGPDFGNTRTVQPKGSGEKQKAVILAGGDNFGNATVIPGLPYADAGLTCTFADDYTPPCGFSLSPDVVYSFTPTADVCVDISLCNATFDTEITVYANNPGTPIVCQDDSKCGLQSFLQGVPLVAGNTYYIVIDGYADACGEYEMIIQECPPPPVCAECSLATLPEGEPTCSNGYVDTYNAGCNGNPPVFTQLPCEPTVVVCGTYGSFDAGATRDTDWYEVTITSPTTITASVTGHGLTGSAIAIIDNNCPPNVLCGNFAGGDECTPADCSAAVGPGTYRIFVASFFDGTPCGSTYVLTVGGLTCPPTPAQVTSWGSVKGTYR